MVTDYKAQTNEIKQIKLESGIQRVQWTRSIVAPGGYVGLEILTKNVGNGAKLKIELSDHWGKGHGKVNEMIVGNRHQVLVHVPVKARDALFADVKLPKHGLNTRSPALLLISPIEITNLKWSAEKAQRGDVLTLTADVEGAPAGAEAAISILEHDADGAYDLIAKFRVPVNDEKIVTEWEYEYHEDTDHIPTAEESEKGYNPPEYFFRVSIFGLSADSDILQFMDWIEFEFLDVLGEPMKDVEVTLRSPDGVETTETTNAEGIVRLEDTLPGQYEVVETKLPDEDEEDDYE